jgi:thermostable 8-oxoguanine DNA glycosylase
MTSRRERGPFREDDEVVPGVRWGRSDQVPSPAFWLTLAEKAAGIVEDFVNSAGSLAEEVGFCLLGGHGVTAEIAYAAFERLRGAGVFVIGASPKVEQIYALLSFPLQVAGRKIRYRFPRQRAERIQAVLCALDAEAPRTDDARLFRADLMRLPGIGPKTASWITRNHLGSDEVAILDVHVIWACQIIGLFGPRVRLPNEYELLENRFLEFAGRLGVRAAVLDALMWRETRVLRRKWATPVPL